MHFSEFEIHQLVAHYLCVRFPTCVALNKIDDLEENMLEVVSECQRMAESRGEVAVPVSARAECCVLRQELRSFSGDSNDVNHDVEDEKLLARTLSRWQSTGVLEAISAAVELNPPTLCYPVADLDTEAPLGSSSRLLVKNVNSGVNGERNSGSGLANPRAEGHSSRLRDCVQLKPSTTVYDLYEALKRDDIIFDAKLAGDFVRADGRGLSEKSARKQLRRDQTIDERNCVIKIYTNKKQVWQKDCR